jgi:hypothetical protein
MLALHRKAETVLLNEHFASNGFAAHFRGSSRRFMALVAACARLDLELNSLATHFREFAAKKPALNSSAQFSFLEECLLEGLLSRVWQCWGEFCRRCVIDSCIGCVTSNGVAIPALPGAGCDADVSGAAIKAKRGHNPPYWGYPNTLLRMEPTWGDINVLTTILLRLAPANMPQLVAGFSSGHARASALQKIRNGAAHFNAQTLGDIHAISSAYLAFPIVHPLHALFWVDPVSSDFLVTKAIEDLRTAGSDAIA